MDGDGTKEWEMIMHGGRETRMIKSEVVESGLLFASLERRVVGGSSWLVV